MAALVPMGPPPARRQRNLTAILEGFVVKDKDGRLQEISPDFTDTFDDIARTVTESKTFRIGSKGWLNQLDRALVEYRKVCITKFLHEDKAIDLETEDETEDANDRIFFPKSNLPDFLELASHYLVTCAHLLTGRSGLDRVRLPTLQGRRHALLHWAREKIGTGNDLPYRQFMARTNAAIMYAARKLGITNQKNPKLFFGRPELQLLLDHDLAESQYPLIAQNFAISWILGCVCGVRPGAIGFTNLRPDDYMRWKHIKFTRQPGANMRFQVQITFPYMKGFQDDHARAHNENYDSSLVLTVRSPQTTDNIPLSLPHRLLIIGISRGIFENIKTYQDLLYVDGSAALHNINIKKNKENDPVILASVPGGRDLSEKAASAHSLYDYLKLRCNKVGFYDGANFYSWRRKAGNRMDAVLGRGMARKFLHHNPDSRSYEKYYEQQPVDVDVGAIAYSEDHAAGAEDLAATGHAVLLRAEFVIKPDEAKKFIDDYVHTHLDRNAIDLTNELKFLRRRAWKALYAINQQRFDQDFTQAEFDKRCAQLKDKSAFTRMIEEAINEQEQQARLQSDSQERSPGRDDTQANRPLDDLEDQEEPLENYDGDQYDLGDDLNILQGDEDGIDAVPATDRDPRQRTVTLETDLPGQVDLSTARVPYHTAVVTFFQIMLGDEQQLPPGAARPCPECQQDGTVDEAQKSNMYSSKYYLDRHLQGNFHSPEQTWRRHIQQEIAVSATKSIKCPYSATCTVRVKPDLRQFVKHLNAVLENGATDDHHDGLMELRYKEDGYWFATRRSAATQAKLRESYDKYALTGRGGRTQPKYPKLSLLEYPRLAQPMAATEPGAFSVGYSSRRVLKLPDEPPAVRDLPRLNATDFRNQFETMGMVGRTIAFGDTPWPHKIPTFADLVGQIPQQTKALLAKMGEKPENAVGHQPPKRAPDL